MEDFFTLPTWLEHDRRTARAAELCYSLAKRQCPPGVLYRGLWVRMRAGTNYALVCDRLRARRKIF